MVAGDNWVMDLATYAFLADKATTAKAADVALNALNLTRITPRATAPSDPEAGDIYVDSMDGYRLKVYDGFAWQSCW